MLEYFYLITLITLFCCGWRMVTDDGMLFDFLRRYYLRQYENGNKLYHLLKPIFGCVTCFASFWGVAICISTNHFDIIQIIICCISASFTNTLMWKIYERI